MKSIISGAVLAIAIVACLSLNVEAKSFNHVAVSDTGKMSKMSKTDKKKMSKMQDSKMSKKKMAKDTSHKM